MLAESGLAALSSEGEGEAAVPVDAPADVPAVPPDPVRPPTNGAPACSHARMSQDSPTCRCRRVPDAGCSAQRKYACPLGCRNDPALAVSLKAFKAGDRHAGSLDARQQIDML